MRFVVDLIWLLFGLLASPWLLYRAVVTGGWRRLPARLGSEVSSPAPAGIWLHGASVGEVTLLRPLVARLERELPHLPLTISAVTSTGAAAAHKLWPQHHVVLLPLDLSFIVRRVMGRMAPRMIVIVEADFWPNFLLAADARRIPVVVVNARVSERSARRLLRTRVVPGVLRRTAMIAAQNETFRQRFVSLGIPVRQTLVTGNMKYDQVATSAEPGRDGLRMSLGYARDELILIGGSLHAGEDEVVLEAFRNLRRVQPVRLILVPRYPVEAAAIAARIAATGDSVTLRSQPGGAAPPDVLVVDTLGELAGLYALADIAFVGGSLYFRGGNKGGHNLMEPAVAGLPVLFGPHHYSFRDTVADLLAAGGGMQVHDSVELTQALVALGTDPERRRAVGAAARRVVTDGQGATQRNFELLRELLVEPGDGLRPQGFDITMLRTTPGTDTG